VTGKKLSKAEAAEIEAAEFVPIIKGRGNKAHRAEVPRGGLELWIGRGYRLDKSRKLGRVV
jgi:hypothetical protein